VVKEKSVRKDLLLEGGGEASMDEGEMEERCGVTDYIGLVLQTNITWITRPGCIKDHFKVIDPSNCHRALRYINITVLPSGASCAACCAC
jgi:hypothetical protein